MYDCLYSYNSKLRLFPGPFNFDNFQLDVKAIILSSFLNRYDFVNPDGSIVKANGFRTVLFLLSSCLQLLLDGLQRAMKQRSTMFYSPVNHLKSLFVHCRALQVCVCVDVTITYELVTSMWCTINIQS